MKEIKAPCESESESRENGRVPYHLSLKSHY